MSLRKPAVILACAAIAIVLLVSMGSLGPEPIESQSSFAQPETFTIKPEVTKFTEVSAVLEPSSTQLEPTASVMDVGLDKLSLFLNPAYAISSTQSDLSYTIYPNGGNYANGDVYTVCGNDVYMSSGHTNKKIVHIDTTTNVVTTWDVTDIGAPSERPACDNSGIVYFGTNDKKLGKLDTQTNTVDWYDFDGTVISQVSWIKWKSGNEVYFHGGNGNIVKFNFDTDTFTKYSWSIPGYNNNCHMVQKFDSSGNLYLVDGGPLVCKLDFSSNTNTYWDLQSLETSNMGITSLDLADNNDIFLGISTHQKIAKIVQSSNLVTAWLIPQSPSGPNSIIVDSSDNVIFTAYSKLWRLVPGTDTFTYWTGITTGWLTESGNVIWSAHSNEITKFT